MTGQVSVDWLMCNEDGCIGIRLDAGDRCLAHAGDQELAAALKQVAQTGKIDARGVTIDYTLLKKILDSTPRSSDGHAMPTEVRFTGATFWRDVGFDEATFRGATFQGAAGFHRATFQGPADFGGATFQDAVWFTEATFQGPTADFVGANFQGDAGFAGAAFQGNAGFDRATFQGNARFDRATFRRDAGFAGATFQGNAGFAGATFEGAAGFDRATFERAQQFGPMLAHRGLILDAVQFAQPVRIEASTIRMCCRRARFPAGVQFRLRWAGIVLDDTDIPAPSLLMGISSPASEELALAEQQIARDWEQELAGHVSEQPRLLSLQRANVAGLGLANVDLADCRFWGAHNLDKLRLEGGVAFKLSPARLSWEQRRVIAEECTWRAGQTRCHPPAAWDQVEGFSAMSMGPPGRQ